MNNSDPIEQKKKFEELLGEYGNTSFDCGKFIDSNHKTAGQNLDAYRELITANREATKLVLEAWQAALQPKLSGDSEKMARDIADDVAEYGDEDCKRFALAGATAALEMAQSLNQWVSCETRLPEYGDPVLIIANGVTQNVTYQRNGADDAPDWFESYHYEDEEHNIPWDKVTHWMPLPQPIREAE